MFSIQENAAKSNWYRARKEGKEKRKSFSQVISEYIFSHEVSENYASWVQVRVSDAVNKFVFGKTAKQLCAERGVGTDELLRDTHSESDLRMIEGIEGYAAICVEKSGMEPLEAILAAIDFQAEPSLF